MEQQTANDSAKTLSVYMSVTMSFMKVKIRKDQVLNPATINYGFLFTTHCLLFENNFQSTIV